MSHERVHALLWVTGAALYGVGTALLAAVLLARPWRWDRP